MQGCGQPAHCSWQPGEGGAREPDVDVAAPAHLPIGRPHAATVAQGLLPSLCTLPPAAANAAAKATLLPRQHCCHRHQRCRRGNAAATATLLPKQRCFHRRGRMAPRPARRIVLDIAPLHLQERCTCAPSFQLPPSAGQSPLRTRSQLLRRSVPGWRPRVVTPVAATATVRAAVRLTVCTARVATRGRRHRVAAAAAATPAVPVVTLAVPGRNLGATLRGALAVSPPAPVSPVVTTPISVSAAIPVPVVPAPVSAVPGTIAVAITLTLSLWAALGVPVVVMAAASGDTGQEQVECARAGATAGQPGQGDGRESLLAAPKVQTRLMICCLAWGSERQEEPGEKPALSLPLPGH